VVSRGTTGLIQRRDGHRDDAVAEGDQYEAAQEPRRGPRPRPSLRQAAPAPMRTCQTPVIPLASVAVSDTSTSLSRTSGFQKVRLRGGRIAVFACRTLR